MPGRSLLNRESALTIAEKLDAEVSEGRRHAIAVVRIDGTYIGRFGIRRSKKTGHDYIPRQIYVSMKQALDLARCRLYREDYEQILKERGKLPQSSSN